MEDRKYTLRVITPIDKRDVIDFLTRFFFIDEPLNIETGMNLDYINGKIMKTKSGSPFTENF